MFRKRLLLLTMFTLFVAGAKGFGQTITISVKGAPIEKVFTLIEQQAGVRFFYKQELLKMANKVTFKLKKGTLKEALDLCFRGQPFLYEVIGNTIVVKEKMRVRFSSAIENDEALPVSFTVKGEVVTATGTPIENATITIKGTKKAVASNSYGRFTILVDRKNTVLQITSATTESVEVPINNNTELRVVVPEKTSELDQVQIIGYGQTTKRFNTGNVTTIRSDEINRQPVNNILAALEGRVPGLVITQKTGLTGGAFDIVMRSKSTFTAGSDPLVLVDGIPFPLNQYRIQLAGDYYFFKFNNTSAKAGGNPLNLINIGDIERVDVLKDADATAIYGSRGGNGIILITTKKAVSGKATVAMNAYSGFGVITRLPKMLNGQQYLEMRREAKNNDNAPVTTWDPDINGTWDTTRYTDWAKELLGGRAAIADVQLSLTGGTSRTSYRVSGSYHRETSVMPIDGADRHAAVFFSALNASKNKKLQTAVSIGYLSKTDDLAPVDFTANLRNYIPNQPASFLPDGRLNDDIQFNNPYKEFKKLYEMKAANLFGNLKISYKPVKGVDVSISTGVNRQHQHDFLGVPKAAQSLFSKSYARYSSNRLTTFIIEPQAQYSITLNNTKLSALVGSTYQNSVVTYKFTSADDFSDEAQLRRPEFATSIKADSSYKNYKYFGSFSRLSFNRDNKYIVNLTGRIDGTSRFGPRKQFHPFGAVGAAWIFSEEAFMKKLRWVNTAKLRGSYGIIGNSDILDYLFSPTYVPVNGLYQGIRGLDPTVLYNNKLGWELKKSLEVGLELQLFKNRLDLAVNVYRHLNSAQLKLRVLSGVTGFNSVMENGETEIENKGFELGLNYTVLKSQNVVWEVRAIATLPKNSLRRFDGIESTPYKDFYTVGHPITSVKVYRLGGVDPQNGRYFFLDKAGNPTTSVTAEDKIASVNTAPRFYGSIVNSINYKSFSLDMHCMFMVRRGRRAFAEHSNIPGIMRNQQVEVLSRWQQPGDRTDLPRYTQDLLAYSLQKYPQEYDGQFADASFIRVKNISLSYSVNKAAAQKLHLKNLRFYFQAQNVFTFSSYKNLDPETTNFDLSLAITRMPLLRMFTAGFQVTF